MVQVELKGLEFKAFHGVHEFERVEGNSFFVDLIVQSSKSEALKSDNLSDTVDYEVLYHIIESEMKIQAKLLENLAYRIAQRIFDELPETESLKIRIAKQNPPIGGKCSESAVTYSSKR